MKKILLTLVVISVFGFSVVEDENEAFEPVLVFELFTSQGCSSCPSADDLLNDVRKQKNNDNVFVLSYHVTYWNYIGWTDPFSKEKFTDKQREYATKFRSRSIYTPQLVVNGKEHFVGSDRARVYKRLGSYTQRPSENQLKLSAVTKTGNNVSFNYDLRGDVSKKRLRAVLVINERETLVKRGENRNRKLKNANIVVQEKYLDLNSNEGAYSITIPSLVNSQDELQLMVLVESEDLSITGAAKTSL